jgi:hypothetical protein
MNREAFATITQFIVLASALVVVYFFYRKVYFHWKFLGLHYPRLKNKPILNLILEPLTLLEHIYILIPIFIRSERRKDGEELRLEKETVRSLTMFWIMFGAKA